MRQYRKSISILLSMIMVLILVAACAPLVSDAPTPVAPETTPPAAVTSPPVPVAPAEPPREGANLAEHINIVGDQPSINVLNAQLSGQTGASAQILRMTHDRLVEIWGPGDYRPGLATSWYTEDFRNIRFHLREGVTFHNGDPFSAEDVLFTFEVSRDHFNTGTAWSRFRAIEEVVVVDRYTVDFIFHEADPDYEFTLSHWATVILNRRAFEENPDDPAWGLVGTGAFRITEFSPGNVVHLERNENFWDDLPPTRSMSWWTIPELATRNVMLQTGDIQVAIVLAADDRDAMLTNPDFDVLQDPDSTPHVLFFNSAPSAPDFIRCLDFRLAVAYALNRADVALVADGNWTRAWPGGSVWGARSEFFYEALPAREFNLDRAREHLERSVWNGETLQLDAVAGLWARAAEMVQLQLGAIGINVVIEVMEAGSLVDAWSYNPESTNQAAIHWLPFGPTALGAVRANLLGGVHSNRMNINSPYIEEQHLLLSYTHDLNEAEQIAFDIQEYLWENVVGVPMFQQVYGITSVRGIGGMHFWGHVARANLTGIYWDLDETPENFRP